MVAVERASLARAFGNVAVDLADLNFGSAIKGVINATGAFKPDPQTPPTAEEGAKLLLQRAAYAAAIRTIQAEARNALALAAEADPREIEAAILGTTADAALELTATAFADPEGWPALEALLTLFDGFMRACAVPDEKRPPIRRAFAAALPLALAGEWRNTEREKEYQALRAALEPTPFDPAAQRSLQWNAYRDRLVKAMHAPLRALNPEKIRCSLNDLYIPLRAAVGDPEAPERTSGERRKRTLVWLDDTLYGWATRTDHGPSDRIRVLSGEPGAGKSIACMKLAACLAAEKRRVLLVPLTRLNIARGSLEVLARYLEGDLGHDPFKSLSAGKPMVLILDGLDELAKSGQRAMEQLSEFITDLGSRLSEWNRDGTRVLLLLSGRPGAAGAVVATKVVGRSDEVRLHVLRYRINENDRDDYEPQDVAALDQRSDWWERFDPEGGIPEALRCNDPHIDSLTEQPLLNWLLAQILTEEGPERAATISGFHDLYTRLFRHVLDRIHRRYPGDGSTEAIDGIHNGLERMLEEVAVAAWHAGTDRAVLLSEVKKRLDDNALTNELNCLSDDSNKALTVLLDSFFCRTYQFEDDVFIEFTHISFFNFLVASRLSRELSVFLDVNKVECNKVEYEINKWLELCGPAVIDQATYNFLLWRLIAKSGNDPLKIALWRDTLCSLLVECLETGMPLPGGEFRSRAGEQMVRNAEIAMLCAAGAIFRISAGKSAPISVNSTILATTLHRLAGPVTEWSIVQDAFHIFDFIGAKLKGTNLRSANLGGAYLIHADLSSADLSNIHLTGANLTGADLTRADLNGASLNGAYLMGAYLVGAHLTGAYLTGANLTGADLTRADMTGAYMTGATLMGAYLVGADLTGAHLTAANLSGAHMMRVGLTRARLPFVNLRGADLRGADLTSAYLISADLTDADLRGAELTGTDLTGANLTGALL